MGTVSQLAERKPYQQAARELMRDSLLDAAGELMQDAPWTEISMAAIASRAGVSRQTLYNEFGSRDIFAQSLALREADRFLTSVESEIGKHPEDPELAMYNALVLFMRESQSNPMIRQIVVNDPGADELLSLFTSRGRPVVDLGTARIAAKILEVWPQASEVDAKTAAEGIVRLAISHAGLPNDSIEDSARSAVTLVAPFIASALRPEG
jgi:AcrR family transcriptional regulator